MNTKNTNPEENEFDDLVPLDSLDEFEFDFFGGDDEEEDGDDIGVFFSFEPDEE